MTEVPQVTEQQWIEDVVHSLARAFDDKHALLKRLADLVAEKFPDRLGTAFWIDAEGGETDRGLSVKLYKRKASSLDLLLGRKSAGGAAFYRVIRRGGNLLPASRAEVSIGGGAAYWVERGEWSPVAGVKVTF